MSIAKRNIRGLQDIHTLSGRVDMVSEPYRAYMKIATIEMEKLRRGKERQSAIHRVKSIDSRFKEIEAEKAALLKDLAERKSNGLSDETPGMGHRPAPRRSKGGFRIRY